MNSIVYLVRHGESPKTDENERMRGLTKKGVEDAIKITEILKGENIDTLISSPYSRSKMTIQGLATYLEKDIIEYEDLKECIFTGYNKTLPNKEVYPLVEKMFNNRDFSNEFAESFNQCQERAINIFLPLLENHKGKKLVIGTHGFIMTAIMNFFDKKYDCDFLKKTTKPDIYKLEFQKGQLRKVDRLWGVSKQQQ